MSEQPEHDPDLTVATTPQPRPSEKRRAKRTQLQIFIAAWTGLTMLIGCGVFVAILWASGGLSLGPQDGGGVSTQTGGGDLFATPQPVVTLPPTPAEGLGGGADVEGLIPMDAFAFGGQEAHGGFAYAPYLELAGMRWVKLQAFDTTVDFGPAIENAHNLGFRILVSVKDEANKDRITDPAYREQLLAYMETLALQGADAIEVWNEPNIEREWPAGQISGAAYTELLAAAYTRIKAANPNTMVISGAPAPTGFFGGACTPDGCDDAPYIAQMVAAGALNYMDCVGVHYNEGILPPTAVSGDPRGNSEHYTRYYPRMVEAYVNAVGGQKPLCFTELGYLAGADNPNLSVEAPAFAWASDVTRAEQAEWLVQAVQLAAADPNVRMVIVFNVGFKTEGEDPQKFYSIVTPDGSCPACDLMSTALNLN